jgi:hypothetical protein
MYFCYWNFINSIENELFIKGKICMITTSRGDSLRFYGSVLETIIDHRLSFDTKHYSYDLQCVRDIIVTCPTEVDENINKTTKSKKRKYIGLGAVLGLAVDYSLGDDSLVDGAIYGATLGWLFTPSGKEVTADIVLVFNDDSRLGLTVDRVSFNHISTLIGNNTNKTGESKPVICRSLTDKEKSIILEKQEGFYSLFMSGLIALIFTYFPPIDFYPSREANEFKSASLNLAHNVIDFLSVNTLYLIFSGIIVGFVSYMMFKFGFKLFNKRQYNFR